MVSAWHRFGWNTIFVASVLWSVCTASAQQAPSTTFVITIALPKPTIHVGDGLAISVTTSNPTDHVVKLGEGLNGGIEVEALNEKAEDVGPHISGSASANRIPRPNFGPTESAIRPGRKQSLLWPLKPDPKYLIPGTYRVRVHNRDMATGAEVYSNSVTLTVLP
jgi:hypothetical protein